MTEITPLLDDIPQDLNLQNSETEESVTTECCDTDSNCRHQRIFIDNQQIDNLMDMLDIQADEREAFAENLINSVNADSLTNIELIAKGIAFDNACSKWENSGYIRGRNEKIEISKRALSRFSPPSSEKRDINPSDFHLHPIRSSVWDD